MTQKKGFNPPPYPYDRLDELKPLGAHHQGGIVDCSIGTPFDAPPPGVVAALGSSDTERGYPPSIGTPEFREAVAAWMSIRLGCQLDPARRYQRIRRRATSLDEIATPRPRHGFISSD